MLAFVDPTDRQARPLEGATVLDLCTLGPGLYCTQLLQRLGARVIRFEAPWGDPARAFPEVHRAFTYEEHFWQELCDVLARPEWKSLSLEERGCRAVGLRKDISEIIRSKPREQWENALRAAGACWAFLADPRAAVDIESGMPPLPESVAGLGEHTEHLKRELGREGQGRETAK